MFSSYFCFGYEWLLEKYFERAIPDFAWILIHDNYRASSSSIAWGYVCWAMQVAYIVILYKGFYVGARNESFICIFPIKRKDLIEKLYVRKL